MATSYLPTVSGDILIEKRTIPLFAPVILGFGIMVGVFNPFSKFSHLLIFVFCALCGTFSIRRYSKVAVLLMLTFVTGIYVSQTGGILETTMLSQKEFLEHEINSAEFTATVKFIDETHPTMKNMQRITLDDMKFTSTDKLQFIRTAKMTCSVRMLHGINPNDLVKIRGKILPYKLAAIPTSFDQRQYNSLIGLDATGIVYTIYKQHDRSEHHYVFSSIRRNITKYVVREMGATAGGIASALLTGDKSSISPEIRDKYINSGTAHILAISGLHMSIVASLIFIIFYRIARYIFLLLRSADPRQYAAVATILVTFFYLKISGASPSAVRAFIMTTIFLLSMLCNRKVVSLRSVAFAAFMILLFDPGSMFLVSFQLSFSAIVALVSAYETLHGEIQKFRERCNTLIQKMCFYIASSALTTTIASIATFPVSVATFNRFSVVGLFGNIVAIPVVSFIVIPLMIATFVTCTFTDVFMIALRYVLAVLTYFLGWISELPGSVITIKSPSLTSLYIIIGGGIILTLLKTRCRYAGAGISLIGTIMWICEDQPDVVIPPNSGVVCFTMDGKFYTTSLQKSRLQVSSIQKSLGFSGKLNKKEYDGELGAEHSRGLYVWTRSGKIKQLAIQKHPYCPAHYTSVDSK
ncbi:MAG: ComEC/Rec2 family competence protein [Holosporales bacterium]|nr:ComEC/Rec2 family competence protein [Holosporales bacterium]